MEKTAKTVLVVEDEALIRIDTVHLLEEAGYAVLEAADADEGIRFLETRPEISVLFTDINMAGSMDGLKLARAVRERWPPVHVIVASGKALPDGEILPERGRFLPKPYTARQVTDLLDMFFATAA